MVEGFFRFQESSWCSLGCGVGEGERASPPPLPQGGTESAPPSAGCSVCAAHVQCSASGVECVVYHSCTLFRPSGHFEGAGSVFEAPGDGDLGLVLPIDGQQHPGMACAGTWEGQIEEFQDFGRAVGSAGLEGWRGVQCGGRARGGSAARVRGTQQGDRDGSHLVRRCV